MVQAIIDALRAEITKYNLELLQRHPKDLEEIDRAMLGRFVHPGMKFAWMVGDSHTHSAPLGVHQGYNELPTYVTNLANNDRFYVLSIGRQPGEFKLQEVERKEFRELVHTPIPYRAVGTNDAFWLYRNESRIGTCTVKREGTFAKPSWKIQLTPMAGISKLDREVLAEWGGRAVIKCAGTLFVHWHAEWLEPIDLALAA